MLPFEEIRRPNASSTTAIGSTVPATSGTSTISARNASGLALPPASKAAQVNVTGVPSTELRRTARPTMALQAVVSAMLCRGIARTKANRRSNAAHPVKTQDGGIGVT